MRLIAVIGAILVSLCILLSPQGLPVAQAAENNNSDISVLIRGEGAGSSQAVADGQKKAVYKVLSHIIRPSQDPGSTFCQLLAEYNSYVVSTQVKKEEKHAGHVDALLEVVVNGQALQDKVNAGLAVKQEENADMPVTFLLRVKGAENAAMAASWVKDSCGTSFQRLGFDSVASDEADSYMLRTLNVPYDAYIQVMNNKLQQEFVDVTFAVVGEIQLETVSQDQWGVSESAHVRAQMVDLLSNTIIGEIEENYDMRGSDVVNAQQLVLQKASLDISEVLARKTIDYWTKKQG